ncbi:hypothetical protein F5882DRAFT_524857 [Hyaloscypha sp. PMI_1271]|nr:hypothetical protein F5882DRAFT_524857 [Hyaloscypha sp. PMI_1271]
MPVCADCLSWMNLAGWVQPPHRSEVATIVPAGAEKEGNAGSRVEESPRHATSSLFVAATGDLQSSLLYRGSTFASSFCTTPTNTDTSLDCGNLDRLPGGALPILAEITFRLHSAYYCSFTVVIRDGYNGRGVLLGQIVGLIASISHMGKINDFTIKPTEQHSFLVTGFSRHASSSLSSVSTIILSDTETGRTHRVATWTRPQPGNVLAQALFLQGSEPSCSDNNDCFSDSDPDSSSDDDCGSSKDGQSLSTRVNLPWDLVQEQRLLAWRKEGKPWKWIFK